MNYLPRNDQHVIGLVRNIVDNTGIFEEYWTEVVWTRNYWFAVGGNQPTVVNVVDWIPKPGRGE